ncbi:MAG TPA: 16S rRNA (cytidine(1402)-2'-O)-methyltransferase [Burkholderiales bacterium]|nr:16S rRNA (cytidine(1402)-2'-O)-methyltransferase [Burkholderiales bacterium]
MVATPIGNLEDIGLRALAVLRAVDLVAAEDTRTASVLLDHHGIRARLLALHEHNERKAAETVLAALREGRDVALVSDAGTPAVSDPGAALVARAREAGFRVSPVPGPNAAIAAVSAAGLAQPGFVFEGFLPPKRAARRAAIERLSGEHRPIVLYEAPHRVLECVEDLAAVLGGARALVIARELTKVFEQIHRCRLEEAAAWLQADAHRQKGEFVLIVEGAPAGDAGAAAAAAADPVLRALLAELPLAQAVRLACAITGAKRNAVYARALELSGKKV